MADECNRNIVLAYQFDPPAHQAGKDQAQNATGRVNDGRCDHLQNLTW